MNHDLPTTLLPIPWDWPAKKRANGWWYLRYGSTERPLHRLAFTVKHGFQYDAIDKSFPCHHCGKQVIWGRNLQVDHLDGDKDNNMSENLVPSCAGCNWRKGAKDTVD